MDACTSVCELIGRRWQMEEADQLRNMCHSFPELRRHFQCWGDFLIQLQATVTSWMDDWNVTLLTFCQIWCQTTSLNPKRASVWLSLVRGGKSPCSFCPVCMPIRGFWMVWPFFLNMEAGKRSHGCSAELVYTPGSHSWFYSQTIHFAALWESAKEKQITMSLSAHTEQTSLFDYGPITGFTLNHRLWG